MSKAFTREDDDRPEQPLMRSALSSGGVSRRYITAKGAARLHAELEEIEQRLARREDATGVEETARLAELQLQLASVEVVPARQGPPECVTFGSTVTVRFPGGEEESFQIVGVDETDPEAGRISWLSPLAAVLLQRRAGDKIDFNAPGGKKALEIVSILGVS